MESGGVLRRLPRVQLDWGNRASGALFMQMSLDECVLHLPEHRGDACPGAAVKLHTDEIQEYVEQLGGVRGSWEFSGGDGGGGGAYNGRDEARDVSEPGVA